uniref:Alpha-1,4-N-acetylglucosaminyltransferase n=1 Tax=Xenopus tropicalis TaxID=8364 RepID=A0A6I8STD0_XENTR
MATKVNIFAILLCLALIVFVYEINETETVVKYIPFFFYPTNFTLDDVLSPGNGIFFIETTDRMDPPSLVLCAVESAARINPDRPVAFFMKGLPDINSAEGQNRARNSFPTLAPYNNIYFFPLRMELLLSDTPLLPWYQKVNPEKEVHWAHVSSDASRLALMYKYGGLYMDTDIISLRPVPVENFLVAESNQLSSNGVFGFNSHRDFTWTCMEDFVKNYNGAIWGHQGPALFTRVLRQFYCDIPPFKGDEDLKCGNVSFLNPRRFYPIECRFWMRFFEVWKAFPTFVDSYALHLFNYANRGERRVMVPGSNTLVEHLYVQNCPATYEAVLEKRSTHLTNVP